MSRKGRRKATSLEMRQARAFLCAMFPNTFVPDGAEKRPLKIRIDKEIMKLLAGKAPGMSRRVVAATLADYTNGIRYLRNLKEGAVRLDLDGSEAGVVTAEQAENAADRLAKRTARINRLQSLEKPAPEQAGA